MKTENLEVVASLDGGCMGCMGGRCPTVYKNEKGQYFVQGYKVTKTLLKQTSVSKDESMVEVPIELLKILSKNLGV